LIDTIPKDVPKPTCSPLALKVLCRLGHILNLKCILPLEVDVVRWTFQQELEGEKEDNISIRNCLKLIRNYLN